MPKRTAATDSGASQCLESGFGLCTATKRHTAYGHNDLRRQHPGICAKDGPGRAIEEWYDNPCRVTARRSFRLVQIRLEIEQRVRTPFHFPDTFPLPCVISVKRYPLRIDNHRTTAGINWLPHQDEAHAS
jgi:hypothetical protein